MASPAKTGFPAEGTDRLVNAVDAAHRAALPFVAAPRYLLCVDHDIPHVADLPHSDGAITSWVLIGNIPGEDDGWNYRTSAVKTISAIGGASGEIDVLIEETQGAWPLKKAVAGQAFASTILVGRATSNDICLPHASVSKLHARLRLTADGIFVSDAGSSNGTILNGVVLREGEELPLLHGDFVRFGQCVLQAFEPAELTALLQRLRR